jgi:hypothetical protein
MLKTAFVTTGRERGLRISENNFVWTPCSSHSKSLITADIIANAKVAGLVLPRECYEDCANGLQQPEVWDAIHDCINALVG